MKITKTEFDKIVKEEVSSALKEIDYTNLSKSPKPQKGSGVVGGLPGITRMAKKLSPIKKSDKQVVRKDLYEDGHEDVSSAKRAMQAIIEDAGEMLQALEQMDGTLPTWWTNKMAVASQTLNKMRDYLLIPTEEISENEDN